ncbi:MAG: methyltransferase domain-containing protein [Archangium sp.]|nr:methyltransferase domain-containing protein [Archangium sp.]
MDDSLRLRARTARVGIKSGALRGDALKELLLSVPFIDRDVWVDELLGIDEIPSDMPGLPPESVPYLPCGVEEVLAVLHGTIRPDDVLVDLGSGLGRVVILAHLLAGIRTHGIELQEHLVQGARARCTELGLDGVTFAHADASTCELEGSIFFLYAPFTGAMLARAIHRLEEIARRRSIVVCAVGLEFHHVPWLRARESPSVSMAIYDSASWHVR